jgi:hypothetical protein
MHKKRHMTTAGIQETNLKTLVTKEDLFAARQDFTNLAGSLKTKIAAVEGGLETRITAVEGKLYTRIAEVEGSLATKITEVKSDIMRWMFAFFVTMILAIIGLYFKH